VDPSQIRLVQHSFTRLAPDAEQIADLCCARLFQLDPALRALLPNDLREPKRAAVRWFARVVADLHEPTRWHGAVRELGRQPLLSTLEARHYDTFGSALIWTLERGLGEEFTFDVLGAWVSFYAQLRQTLSSKQGEISR